MSHKVRRQNIRTLQSHTTYNGCAIYVQKIDHIQDITFRNCSFREKEVMVVQCKSCSFFQCNFHTLEINLSKDLHINGGFIQDLTIINAPLTWIEGQVQVRKLRLPLCKLDFQKLQYFEGLQSLDISARYICSEELQNLQLFSQLTILNLSGTKIAKVNHLCSLPKLTTLNLSYNHLNHGEWEYLSSLTDLVELNIGNTNIYNHDVDFLLQLPQLQKLYLGYTAISSVALETITHIPILRKLEIPYTAVCDEAIPILIQMTELQHLNVYYSRMSPEGIDILRKEMPWCHING